MKKVIYTFSIVLLIMLFSNFCYADYGIPGIIDYDAKIINEKGAKAEHGNEVIPYGETVHVIYEVDGCAAIEYNKKTVNVKLEDIKPVTEEVDFSKAKDTQKDMFVYREGAYLYKGPSITYGKVDGETEIPVGTRVKIESCTDMWGYVEYNGIKGWVYIYTSDEVSPYNMDCSLTEIADKVNSHYYTLKDISVSSTVDGKNVVGTIAKDSSVDFYFYSEYPDPHGKSAYIKYEDIEGWYLQDEEEVYADYSKQDVGVYVYKDLDIYSEISNASDYTNTKFTNKLTTIPANTECKLVYSTLDTYVNYIKVDYNGTQGWIKDDGYSIDESKRNVNNPYQIKLKEKASIIDKDTYKETGETLESGKILTVKYMVNMYPDSYFCVINDDEEIWIKASRYENVFDSEPEYDNLKDSYVDISQFEIKEDDTNNSSNSVKDDNNKKKRNVDDELESDLIYCIVGAVCVAIIAIIVIIVINKKKKSKE